MHPRFGRRPRGLRLLFCVLAAAAFVLIAGWVTMALWNALLPALFGVARIGWLQAVGLLVLGRLLFGGRVGRCGGGPGSMWRGRMMRRWEQMNPAEREQLRQRWCCAPREGAESSRPAPGQPAGERPPAG